MPAATPLHASPFALRPFADGDVALYVALFTDAEVMRAVGAPFAPDRAARAAASALGHQQEANGRFRHWVIEHPKGPGGLVGLALRGERWSGGEAELGVLLWPATQARGAATAAIRAVRPWAFEVAGLAALTCHHADGHAAAAALMRRTGFRPCAPASGAAPPCGWRCDATDAAPQAPAAALR
jgi:RimJ/RimL family protein N-acetyltransferase